MRVTRKAQMKTKLFLILVVISAKLCAQFAGPVGTANTTAMHKDSSAFVAWAASCKVVRGYQDISNPSLGYVTVGDSSMVIGKADGNSIVSLGDGGMATVTFSFPISNGPGYDFAVFENGFNDTFLELAFVEVSSDGINYFRFPATSNSQTTIQFTNGAVMDATKIDNLAGKYRASYGTPFDLQDLAGASSLLNVNAITHIMIIDVVGSIDINYARFDKNNNIINDPWPTPFPQGGFDLDGIGVIHQSVGIKEIENDPLIMVYPNPVNSKLKIKNLKFGKSIGDVVIFNLLGEAMQEVKFDKEVIELNIETYPKGIYFVKIENIIYKIVKD